MRFIAAALLGFLLLADQAAAQTSTALWQGSRTSGDATIFFNSGQGVTIQDGGRPSINVSGTPYLAIGDGSSHPLSGRYASLAAAQAVCPEATSLTQEIDWCAMQGAIDTAKALAPISGEQATGNSSGAEIVIGRGLQLYTGTSTLVANNVALTIAGQEEMGSAVLVGTSGAPWLQFGMSNGMAPQSATLSSTGQGFSVGDTLTLTGGTCATPPIITVNSITDGGSINTTAISTAGNCAVPPSNPLSYATTGTGINASINGTFSGTALSSIAFVGTGASCANGNTLTLIGGSTPGGSPVATVLTVTNAVAGVIQPGGVSITTPGSYGTPPANPVSATGSGSCSGAQFNISNFTNRGGSLTIRNLHLLANTPNAYFVQAQTNLNFRSMFWRNLKFDYTGNNNWAEIADLSSLTNALFQNIDVLNNLATISNNTVGFIVREQNNLLGHYEHRWQHVNLGGGFQTGWDYKLTDAPGFQGLRWDYCSMGQGNISWYLENTSAAPTSYVSVDINDSFHQAAQFLNLTTASGVRLTNNDISAGHTRLPSPPASTDEVYLNNVRQLQLMNNIFSTGSAEIPTVTFVHFVGVGLTTATNNHFSNLAGATVTAYVADANTSGVSEADDQNGTLNVTSVSDAAAFGKNIWSLANTPGHLAIWGRTTSIAFPGQLGFPVDGGPNPVVQAQGGARWYASPQPSTANTTPTTGRLYYVPIYISNRTLVANIGFNIQTVSAGTWHARMGIYTDGSDPMAGTPASSPSTLIANTDTGDQTYTAASTAGISVPVNAGGGGVRLSAGWYWLAFTYSGDASLKLTTAAVSTGWLNNEVMGTAGVAAAVTGLVPALYSSFSYSGVEALPSTAGTLNYNAAGAPVLAITAQAP